MYRFYIYDARSVIIYVTYYTIHHVSTVLILDTFLVYGRITGRC
jgi:hypothetical protein